MDNILILRVFVLFILSYKTEASTETFLYEANILDPALDLSPPSPPSDLSEVNLRKYKTVKPNPCHLQTLTITLSQHFLYCFRLSFSTEVSFMLVKTHLIYTLT